MLRSSDHPALLQNTPNIQKRSDSGTKDSCVPIKQYLVVVVVVVAANFTVKHTTTKTYTANTFVPNIYIRNKISAEGPGLLLGCTSFPHLSLPSRRGPGPENVSHPILYILQHTLLLLNLKICTKRHQVSPKAACLHCLSYLRL